MFDQYDVDHDGRIPLDDFKRRLTEGNHHLNEDIPQEVLDEILERADWDKDRVITFEDFLRMVLTILYLFVKPLIYRILSLYRLVLENLAHTVHAYTS